MRASTRTLRWWWLCGCLLLAGLGAALPGRAAPTGAGADTAAVADSADSALVDSAAATAATQGDSASLVRAAEFLTAKVEDAPPETLAAVVPASAPVFLAGSEIFRVRAARDGLEPAARASAIQKRLKSAVVDTKIAADSVRLLSTPQGVEVRLGPYFLWVITPGDVDGLSPGDLATLIAELPERIRAGVEKERARRRPLGVLVSGLIALGLTLVAWFLLRLLVVGGRRWKAWLKRFLSHQVQGIRLRDFEVLSRAQVTGLLTSFLVRLDVVAGAVLVYAYLTLVFSLFPWTQGWSWQLLNFARIESLKALTWVAGAVPGLLMIGVIVIVFRWLTQLSDRFFDTVERGSLRLGGMHPELARPSKRIAKIFLWAGALAVAFPYIPGAQTKAVQGVSLFLGVLVSLGSTGIVGNVIAGIVLTYSRSFRPGDRIRIGEQVGDVTSLGFFATKITNIRNEEVTIPNGQVTGTAIVNYTRLAEESGLILHTEVTIGYDVDWRRVHELLIEAAGRVEGFEKEPAPWVFQRSLNDYHVSYELNAVTRDSHAQLRLYSRLHEEIQDGFARAGIEILSPGFHALRDANAPVLPQEPKGPRAEPGGFRLDKS